MNPSADRGKFRIPSNEQPASFDGKRFSQPSHAFITLAFKSIYIPIRQYGTFSSSMRHMNETKLRHHGGQSLLYWEKSIF